MKRLFALCALALAAGCSGQTTTTTTTQTIQRDVQAGAITTTFKDTLLLAAIRTKLLADDIDSTTRVHVKVTAANVTLSGRVATVAEKTHVLSAVRAVRGVKSVADELTVGNAGPSVSQTARDAGLVAEVEGAMAAQAGVNVSGVKVGAKDGVVTLVGHVPTMAIKSTMLDAARKAGGVRIVIDQMAVKP
jgi:osmotically-inducible protein OsmY